jgi:archaemetzincin
VIGIYQQHGLDFFDSIHGGLLTYLNLESESAGFFDVPEHSFDPVRKQYQSGVILDSIARRRSPAYDYVAGVVDVDIFSPGMNFVFGLANPIQKATVVSSHRLGGENCDERVAKEVIHEMGHLLGLGHCRNPQCIMYFSNTLSDTDHKGPGLCDACRREIG